MHGREAGTTPQGQLQRGDVREPDHQFRIGAYRGHVQHVDDALRAVAAPGADQRPYRRVAQGRVERGEPLVVGTGEVSVPGVDVGAEPDREAPAGEQLDAPGDALGVRRPGRGDQHDRVPGA